MSSEIILPIKNASETITTTFDFLSQLSSGETVSSAVATSVTWSGTDTNPSAVVGTVSVLGESQVLVKLTGGVEGNIYLITVKATTSQGDSLVMQAFLTIASTVF